MQVCRECGNENQPEARFCNWCGATLGRGSATGLLPAKAVLQSGRYIIVERVGQGGMGAVYKALDTVKRRGYVAVKEMSQSGLAGKDLQEAIAAFASEAEMLTRLQHKSLPRIYQQFEEEGRRYLVMEFIEGETVEHYNDGFLQRGKHMPVDQVLDIAIQLCEVLDYLHSQQPSIIFRDLKPANVMLSPQGRVYLIDFGIARLFKPQQARDTVVLGSPGYAPPEQYNGATSPRSDVFSLGATMHQLLSGKDPTQNPLHFKPFSYRVPELEKLVMRMVDLDAAKRPGSAKYVQQALLKIARGLHLTSTSKPVSTSSMVGGSSGGAAPTNELLTMYVIVSPAGKDQQLWKTIHDQLKVQFKSLSYIYIDQADLSGQQKIRTMLDHLVQADLILCLLSEDFLQASLCMALAQKAIDRASVTGTPALAAILRPCDWQETHLADMAIISPDVIMHSSSYAQQLRILDVAKRIRSILARMLLTGKQTGSMNLSQWLLWQLYGNGETNCPFFVIGQHTIINVRPSGRGGILFYIFDHHNGYVVSEHVIISPTSTAIDNLLHIVAPTIQDPEDVQGLALRERPVNLTLEE